MPELAHAAQKGEDPDAKKIPYLKPGATIGITSPAGTINPADIEPTLKKLAEWGFNTIVGDTIGKKDGTFGGTDEERRADFQRMLDDDKIDAVLCARGGYGFIRIIDNIDFEGFRKNPKWIIGFSDVTVLHAHINSNFGIPSIHSKMCNSFPEDWSKADAVQVETIESIRKALTGDEMQYTAAANINNRPGEAKGKLVGGNLVTLTSLMGSASAIDTKDKILFIEDTGEYPYSVDRALQQLLRAGRLDKLKGLLVGGFKLKKDSPDEDFGRTLEQIVMEKAGRFDYPVGFDFPVGHQKNNFALRCNIPHKLTIDSQGIKLVSLK